MSETGRKTKKIYYSMGEVSEMFDVNPSLIRFWEQKFSILKPEKNKKGNRLFTQQDVDNLKLIYHLVKENGMTLAGAQKRLKENREGLERNLEIIERLQSIKTLLLEVRQELKEADVRANEIRVDEEPGNDWAIEDDALASADVAESDSEQKRFIPQEQPLFPEYVTPQSASPEEVCVASDEGSASSGETSNEVRESEEAASEETIPTGKRMQIIEQTLF